MPKVETTPFWEGRGNDEADEVDIPALSEFNINSNIIRLRPNLLFNNVPERRASATWEMALNGSKSFQLYAVQGTSKLVTNLTGYSAQQFSVAAHTRSAEIPGAPAPTPNVVTPSTMTPSAPAPTPSSETFSAATSSTVTSSALTPGTVPPSAAARNVVTPSTVPPSAAACSVVTPGTAAPNSRPSSQHGSTTFRSTGAPAANTLSPAADTIGGSPREHIQALEGAPSPRQQQQQGLVTRPPGRRPVSLPQILVDPPSLSSAGLPDVPDRAMGQRIPPHRRSLRLPARQSTEDDNDAVLPEAGGLGEALRPLPPRSSFRLLVRALPYRRHVSIEVLFD